MSSGGSSGFKWILILFVALPILATTCSTIVFCGGVKRVSDLRQEKKAEGAACPSGSPCRAATSLLEAAGRADTEAIKGLLADPGWFGRLPAAATATPQERGQFLLRSLLGLPVNSLEELRAKPIEWRVAETRTALDGTSAEVRIEFRNAPGQAEIGAKTLTLSRVDGDWRASP